jgi:hypothetical protein
MLTEEGARGHTVLLGMQACKQMVHTVRRVGMQDGRGEHGREIKKRAKMNGQENSTLSILFVLKSFIFGSF